MALNQRVRAAVILVIAGCLAVSTSAQNEEQFVGRLSPVPVDGVTRDDVTGIGSLSAVLAGTRLSITGSFTGLGGPATEARLHRGLATGVRGTAFHDLTVSEATAGSVSGVLDLTPDQVDSLRNGRLYVQIHSEKAPDGNLWGWLLK